MTSVMSGNPGHGSFWQRLTRGTRWTWRDPRFRAALPANLEETVMGLDARDRLHTKQGRSTARVVLHGPDGPMPVYLKRHYRMPWLARLAALVNPRGGHTPGAAEFAHLNRARALGVAVPDVVAAGERIGPWGQTQSFLMVAELFGSLPLHEAMPELHRRLNGRNFEAMKRGLVREMAAHTAALHGARVFHKDLYLCHFYLDLSRPSQPGRNLTLIDLHRLHEHRWWPDRWRWKDLGQLLYSTHGVAGITLRDVLRFFVHYRRMLALPSPRWHARMIAWKADRYLRHNTP
jgi:heptose I phosphotransferase